MGRAPGAAVSYLSADDLVARFGAAEIDELAPPNDPAARTATIDAAIGDACAEIDGVIAETYTLPLRAAAQWPILVAIGADLARARLYDAAAPERVLGRLSAARNRLERIGTGELRLLDASGVEADRHPTVMVDRGVAVATRTALRGYLDPVLGSGR